MPTREWYDVKACTNCGAVLAFREYCKARTARTDSNGLIVHDARAAGWYWFRWDQSSADHCKMCGEKNAEGEAEPALWFRPWIWYKPWTWFVAGSWHVRSLTPPEDLLRMRRGTNAE